jgi:hypothetical protein
VPDAGWSSPILAPWLDSGITDVRPHPAVRNRILPLSLNGIGYAAQASQAFFGNAPLQMGEGGSIVRIAISLSLPPLSGRVRAL